MTDKPTEIKKKPEPVKAHCPTCDGERLCEVHGQAKTAWAYEDRQFYMNGGADHFLLQCRGCETVFYQKESWDSESYSNYYDENGDVQTEAEVTTITHPSPESKTKPVWLDAIGKKDGQLENILDEMYVAFDHNAYILTAVGLRTALDRATEVIGIDPAISFEEKLKQLKDDGWVGATEHDILDVITNAGNAAAHRGWSPSKKDVRKLLTAMEAFLHRAFIVGQDALAIKANIPPKPKRKKAEKKK